MGQSQERGQGVNFKLSLPDGLGGVLFAQAQVHRDAHHQLLAAIVEIGGAVALSLLELLEGVGVGVEHDELGLGIEQSPSKLPYVRACMFHKYVGQKLVGTVPQPHRLDVSRYYVQ